MIRIASFICLIIISYLSLFCSGDKEEKVPYQANEFKHVYKPKGDVFPGPSTIELEEGKYYDTWVPNDHTILKGKDQKWHMYGITHPITSMDRVHDGEHQSFHSIANVEDLYQDSVFIDQKKILPPSERPGEILENHAPYVIEKDGLYHMIYGPSPIRLATSNDLMNWEPKGELFSEEKGARDPSVCFYNEEYYVIYCSERKVKMRKSKDLINWSKSIVIFEALDFDPESPTIICNNDSFYLFVCSWNGVWDKKEIQGAYQHKTYVYLSDIISRFDANNPITTLNAHAPEIFKVNDQWYISSVEWPNRGVSFDKLYWK
jgi:beta-fructofuranosidase